MIGFAPLPNRRVAQFGTVGAAVLVLAVVSGWHSGEAVDLPAAQTAPTPWALPREDVANTARDAAFLRTRRPWGGGAAFRDTDAGPQVPVAQPWALLGTIVRDDRRYALIRVGPSPTGQIEYRVRGDKMPDGSTVAVIDGDGITTTHGGGAPPTIHRLFAQKP